MNLEKYEKDVRVKIGPLRRNITSGAILQCIAHARCVAAFTNDGFLPAARLEEILRDTLAPGARSYQRLRTAFVSANLQKVRGRNAWIPRPSRVVECIAVAPLWLLDVIRATEFPMEAAMFLAVMRYAAGADYTAERVWHKDAFSLFWTAGPEGPARSWAAHAEAVLKYPPLGKYYNVGRGYTVFTDEGISLVREYQKFLKNKEE